MNQEIKIEEEIKEINPIEEYLNNYKEHKLAQLCVEKDKKIANLKQHREKLIKEITDMRNIVENHNKMWNGVDSLYQAIKGMSVEDYLKLYHKISNDVSGSNISSVNISSGFINENKRLWSNNGWYNG